MPELKNDLPSTGTWKNMMIYFLLFVAGSLVGSIAFDLLFSVISLPASWLYQTCRGFGTLAFTMLLFWAYTTKALHLHLRDFGITVALRGWAIICAILLPTAVTGLYLTFGQLTVTEDLSAGNIFGCFAISVAFALSSGILEEMLFRGFIMRLAERRWGKFAAILAPSFLFACVHIPSMGSFSLIGVALLLLSGTLVGVMFSLVADRSGSVSNSALIHAVWNFVMILSILHITTPQEAYGAPLLTITIPSEPVWLTGGAFGVEASIISCCGYAAVCIVALAAHKNAASK